MQGFNELFTQYNRSLQVIDRRTGGYGATMVSSSTAQRIFRNAIYEVIDQNAISSKAAGINDNSIASRLRFYHSLFDDAKWLIIIRHPIPRAISAWHHNKRLADEENNAAHLELLAKGKSYEGWIKQLTLGWNEWITKFHSLIDSSPRIESIRFEDLVQFKKRELRKVYRFLQVDTSDSVLDEIVQKTGFQKMRNAARRPKFLRQGSLSPFDPSLDSGFVKDLLDTVKEGLSIAGYEQCPADVC